MLLEASGRNLPLLAALKRERRVLWERACEAARITGDPGFGVKLLACDVRFWMRMPLLRLVSWAGLLDSQGRLLDPLRETRRLLGAERPK